MSATDTPPTGNRGRGGNFRPLVIRGLGEPRIQAIAVKQQLAIGQAVYSALESGQGVLFSPTRDLGAISVILYGPGDPQQTYAASEAELEEALKAIQERSAAQMKRGTATPLNGRKTGS
jgi:hypothetical protein